MYPWCTEETAISESTSATGMKIDTHKGTGFIKTTIRFGHDLNKTYLPGLKSSLMMTNLGKAKHFCSSDPLKCWWISANMGGSSVHIRWVLISGHIAQITNWPPLLSVDLNLIKKIYHTGFDLKSKVKVTAVKASCMSGAFLGRSLNAQIKFNDDH